MSTLYRMTFILKEYNPEKKAAIKAAIEQEWEISGREFKIESKVPSYCLKGEDYLTSEKGYESEVEERFADKISLVIWKANAGYCSIDVVAVWQEGLHIVHSRDKADYKRLWKKEAERKRELFKTAEEFMEHTREDAFNAHFDRIMAERSEFLGNDSIREGNNNE